LDWHFLERGESALEEFQLARRRYGLREMNALDTDAVDQYEQFLRRQFQVKVWP
jgi:hypothetical protein